MSTISTEIRLGKIERFSFRRVNIEAAFGLRRNLEDLLDISVPLSHKQNTMKVCVRCGPKKHAKGWEFIPIVSFDLSSFVIQNYYGVRYNNLKRKRGYCQCDKCQWTSSRSCTPSPYGIYCPSMEQNRVQNYAKGINPHYSPIFDEYGVSASLNGKGTNTLDSFMVRNVRLVYIILSIISILDVYTDLVDWASFERKYEFNPACRASDYVTGHYMNITKIRGEVDSSYYGGKWVMNTTEIREEVDSSYYGGKWVYKNTFEKDHRFDSKEQLYLNPATGCIFQAMIKTTSLNTIEYKDRDYFYIEANKDRIRTMKMPQLAFSPISKWYDHLRVCAFISSMTLMLVRLFVVILAPFLTRVNADPKQRERCFSCIRCTAGSEVSCFWLFYMPSYILTYMQWFLVESNWMQLTFDLAFENLPSLLIKYGEFTNGEITAEGYLSLLFTCVMTFKMVVVMLIAIIKVYRARSCLVLAAAALATTFVDPGNSVSGDSNWSLECGDCDGESFNCCDCVVDCCCDCECNCDCGD